MRESVGGRWDSGGVDQLSDLISEDLARAFAALGEQPTVGSDAVVNVRTVSHVMPISAGLAMDYGLIPDTRPPVKISRWDRLRWRWRDRRSAARLRLASWIAGFDVTDTDY